MIAEAIATLVCGQSLTMDEAVQVMEEIMSGQTTPAQFAAFATALRMKGETVDEIAGLASVMQAKATCVHADPDVVDTCGTGGDDSASFNISTAAAFVVTGAGVKVAKHGNRAMSSRCGSADVLEALGVTIDLGPDEVARCLDEAGIAFMFAPLFHPAMKHASAPRREIGVRTVFNILGPLTNPARARFQLIGVHSRETGDKIASVLHRLGTEHSLVVHGMDGMDEVSSSGPSLVWDVGPDGASAPYEITPEHFGFTRGSPGDIRGGDAGENAHLLRSVLSGEKGNARNVVVMNAAAALVAANRASDLAEAGQIAEHAIDSGSAELRLNRLIEVSYALGRNDRRGEA